MALQCTERQYSNVFSRRLKWDSMGQYVTPARSLVGSKPYRHLFSEKHHIGMAHSQYRSLCMRD